MKGNAQIKDFRPNFESEKKHRVSKFALTDRKPVCVCKMSFCWTVFTGMTSFEGKTLKQASKHCDEGELWHLSIAVVGGAPHLMSHSAALSNIDCTGSLCRERRVRKQSSICFQGKRRLTNIFLSLLFSRHPLQIKTTFHMKRTDRIRFPSCSGTERLLETGRIINYCTFSAKVLKTTFSKWFVPTA